MKILTFTTLYPNAAQPRHGVFVENRLRHLVDGGNVAARVVAPVPWFPLSNERLGAYAAFAKAPARETRHGIVVDHPRYPVIPKIGMTIAPVLLYMAVKGAVRRVIDEGFDFDLIDAHYFFPDGVAAAMLGQALDKPVTITARGTDINLIPKYALPRRMILWSAHRARALISVCQALEREMIELGIDANKTTVLRNGVDLQVFQPVDRISARRKLKLTRTTLLSVGHLIPRKAHDLVIRALTDLPDLDLVIVGEGSEKGALVKLTRNTGVEDRVRFLGGVPHDEMKELYSAADILVLASSREGWANVLLEAMACGTPVVASNVWGTPEVVAAPQAGILMSERSPEGIVSAVRKLISALPDRAATRAYAEKFGWDDTARGLYQLLSQVVADHRP